MLLTSIPLERVPKVTFNQAWPEPKKVTTARKVEKAPIVIK